jgi:hypothetical protein
MSKIHLVPILENLSQFIFLTIFAFLISLKYEMQEKSEPLSNSKGLMNISCEILSKRGEMGISLRYFVHATFPSMELSFPFSVEPLSVKQISFLKTKPNSVAWARDRTRPNVRRFSAKLVPSFVGRGCHVVCVTDPYGLVLGFWSHCFFLQAAP